jgi:hypothetical protein
VLVPEAASLVLLVAVGASALGLATWLAVREHPAGAGTRARATSPLVPWVGSALAVLLATRGALAGAGVVLVATLLHAGLARWRAVGGGSRGPQGRSRC